MIIKIEAFGIAKDILEAKSIEIEVQDDITIKDLKIKLLDIYPAFINLHSLAIALNEEYAEDMQTVKKGDEIVLIPPVSGG